MGEAGPGPADRREEGDAQGLAIHGGAHGGPGGTAGGRGVRGGRVPVRMVSERWGRSLDSGERPRRQAGVGAIGCRRDGAEREEAAG